MLTLKASFIVKRFPSRHVIPENPRKTIFCAVHIASSISTLIALVEVFSVNSFADTLYIVLHQFVFYNFC